MLNKSKGFTLVEIAISLIILGIFIAPLIALYGQYQREKNVRTTLNNTQRAYAAVQNYAERNRRYPCPAPLNITRGPANGTESRGVTLDQLCLTAGLTVVTNTAGLPGTFIATNGGVIPRNQVLIGALPFRSLQIQEDEAYDAYGGRILYAVTTKKTNDVGFDQGAISIVDESDNEIYGTTAASFDFVILSHGPNSVGAFNITGAQVQACDATTPEGENCNNNAVFRTRSHAPAGNQFDDVVIQFGREVNEPWNYIGFPGAKSQHITDLPDYLAIGGQNPTAGIELDITSIGDNINSLYVAGAGRIRTDQICETDGTTNCFRPEQLTDADTNSSGMPSFMCPNDKFMVGIQNHDPICVDSIDLRCPLGSQFMGLHDGTNGPINTLDCTAPTLANCPDTPLTGLCESNRPGDNYNIIIPARPHNATVTVGFDNSALTLNPYISSVTGTNKTEENCRRATFTCNNGTWNPPPPPSSAAWSGQCYFQEATTRGNPSIQLPCDGGTMRFFQTQFRTICNGPAIQTVIDATQSNAGFVCDDPICTGSYEREVEPCPAGTSGTGKGRERLPSYTSGGGSGCGSFCGGSGTCTPGTWTPFDDCTCNPPADASIGGVYDAATADDNSRQNLTCPDPSAKEITSAGTVIPDGTGPYNLGAYYEERTYDVNSCAWSTWAPVGQCSCTLPPKDFERDPPCLDCQVPDGKEVYDWIIEGCTYIDMHQAIANNHPLLNLKSAGSCTTATPELALTGSLQAPTSGLPTPGFGLIGSPGDPADANGSCVCIPGTPLDLTFKNCYRGASPTLEEGNSACSCQIPSTGP